MEKKKRHHLSCSVVYMGVSKNNSTPKSSILIGVFHEINHPFWGVLHPPIFGSTPIYVIPPRGPLKGDWDPIKTHYIRCTWG